MFGLKKWRDERNFFEAFHKTWERKLLRLKTIYLALVLKDGEQS